MLSDAIGPNQNLFDILEVLTEKLNHPFSLHFTDYTVKSVLVCTLLYGMGVGIYYSNQRNYRRKEEYGSAKWGDVGQTCKKYRDKRYGDNLLLTQNFRMGLDCYKHRRNLNVLVVGGSGAGKSRSYALPNILQGNSCVKRSWLKRLGRQQMLFRTVILEIK